MVDKVADLQVPWTGIEKDGTLRNQATISNSSSLISGDEAKGIPTLAEAYQEHRDQNAFEKVYNVEAT